MDTPRAVRAAVLAVGAAVLAGIGPFPSAYGAPRGFPNTGDFAPVDPVAFIRPPSRDQRWTNGYAFFRTPDGVSCAIGATSWCTGTLPGLRADQQSVCPSVSRGAGATDPFSFAKSDQQCAPSTDAVLRPGQKLTNEAYSITCVVGAGALTACIDDRVDHGFVLQPSGSWTS